MTKGMNSRGGGMGEDMNSRKRLGMIKGVNGQERGGSI